jgi:methyl coenzyme M reductase subunit C-like uncharacterized protein (methanogenesis marker protein 7)
MRTATLEIRVAQDNSAAARVARWREASLLHRSDRLLDELETLNLAKTRFVPASLVRELQALAADLPAVPQAVVKDRLSPQVAVDLVFDMQQPLLTIRSGVHPDDGEEWAQAS